MKNMILVLFLLTSGITFAQGRLSDEKWKEFEAQKVAFFTREMDLTPEEAAVFWPLYNQMRKKVGEAESGLRKNNQSLRAKKNAAEADYRQAVIRMLENEQAVTTIKKTYYQKMLETLPASKVWKLEQAERKFHRQLFDKLRRESCPKK